jgi:FkbH-like protein
MDKNIKLIIWDLDETFWSGTLDEGPITRINENVDLLRQLNGCGVVNSICSKNNFEKAKSTLEEMSVWDEFIMPQISWSPKGESVKQIIDNFQLRAENVLFIDDHELNLNEALFYNPGIKLLNPLKELLGLSLKEIIENNKIDGGKRFGEYKVLEKKQNVKQTYSSNDLFLRESGIKISIDKNCLPHKERIEDLINRTNQLNYTKKRLNAESLSELLSSSNENFCIHASDRFGNYGLIGFVSFDRSKNTFDQFVFSCRTLNMGIEQYIWNKFLCPYIEISGEIATPLIKNSRIDWISEVDALDPSLNFTKWDRGKANKILMIGGCDVEQVFHYLTAESGIDYYCNYPSGKYGMAAHRDGIHYLYGSRYYTPQIKQLIYDTVPFAEEKYYSLPDFKNYDIIIYSALIDYVQCVYQHRNNPDVTISFGDFTESTSRDWSFERKDLQTLGVPEEKINIFIENWICVGPVSSDAYKVKLNKIFNNYDGILLLVGGVEKTYPSKEQKYVKHHQELNAVLKAYAETRKAKTFWLNMDELITSKDDFTNAIRHYKRPVYSRMAETIIKAIPSIRKKPAYRKTIDKILKKIF